MSEKNNDDAVDTELDDLTAEGESADDVKGGAASAFKYDKQ